MANSRDTIGLVQGMARTLRLALLAASVGASLVSAHAMAAEKAAILLPGSINDQSWNAQGYEGVKRLKAMGWDVAYSENVQPADMAQAMRDYARRGYNVVIGHTGRFQSAAESVGPKFPKTLFVVGSGSAGSGKNVTSVDYANSQFGYLEGVLAARMSKTGKVGSVNGLEGLPNVVAQVGAFRKGAQSVRPDIQVKIIYIQDMEDAGAAKEAALSLISWGADFLTGKLNAGQSGIIAAAKDKNVYATGRSVADSDLAPQNVLTNIVEKWGDMYGAIADSAAHGSGGGEYRLYGLNTQSSTGAELLYKDGQPFNSVVPPAVVQEINDDEKKFASGALKVTVTAHDARGGL
ncbi:MAG TPA: BMP family protein [Pararobbsia sp.]|nr:BMP family protein [Pararobbsia sp.]